MLLTKREKEILPLLCLSNEQIADKLIISIRTVKAHVHHIFDKMNCYTRLQAILLGLKSGMISFDEIEFPDDIFT